ncbi:uncharacterized protein LOC117926114 [Vitis riparia]|uniref:uncharacterized protein LOC117926114 n=1 Tax=Vitis riparia TaxID=96939 RepID=UPI00155AB1CF|nr:uncharacterized protein LOC117926114 [Vitis riparia]
MEMREAAPKGLKNCLGCPLLRAASPPHRACALPLPAPLGCRSFAPPCRRVARVRCHCPHRQAAEAPRRLAASPPRRACALPRRACALPLLVLIPSLRHAKATAGLQANPPFLVPHISKRAASDHQHGLWYARAADFPGIGKRGPPLTLAAARLL